MPRVDISAEPLFTVGPLIFTNSMVGAVLASLILLSSAWIFVRREELVPDRVQGLIELPLEWVAGMVSSGGGTRWRSYVGLVIGIFIFVLVANWLGLLPGVGTIGIIHQTADGTELIPLVRPASADLNFTLGLALVSFAAFTGIGIRVNGVRRYLRHLLVAEPWWMTPIVTPIHLVSEFARLISLSIRLFGNVYAGEALLAIMAALVPVALPVVFLGLEMLFGFVQALVFALLTMAYVILAIAEEQGHEAGHNDGGSEQGHGVPITT